MTDRDELDPQPFDFHSLADFERDPRGHLSRLQETGRAAILSVDAKAQVVVQRASAYQELLDRIDQAETIIAIQEGFESIDRGEGRSAREVIEAIRVRVRTGETSRGTKKSAPVV
ncbi:MAG TPA: hypothetical protein VF746_27970 [Longimicrobium sp.]|jgi:hypothetical protein